MSKIESSSSVGEQFKSIIKWTGIAVFGAIGYEIVADAGGSVVERIAGVLGGAFVGKAVTDGIVK